MIEFRCKNCDARMGVGENHAGESVDCPRCKAINVVPPATASGPTEAPAAPAASGVRLRPVTSSRRRRHAQPGRSTGVTVGIVVGAAALVTAIIILLNQGSTRTDPGGTVEKKAPPKPWGPAQQKPGTVSVTVTWQDSGSNGPKPDTDAVVILIPKPLRGKLPRVPAPDVLRIGLEGEQKKFRSRGAYLAQVGGDGKAILNRVRPGKYSLVLVSRHTNDSPDLREEQPEELASYFQDPAVENRTKISAIEVLPGEQTDFSHDFGITYGTTP